VKKLPAEETGVVADGATLRGFALGTLAGFAGVALVAGALVAMGAATIRWRAVPGWVLGPGLVAFALNALFQQLGVQSLALAARGGPRMTWGAAVLPLLMFVGPHLAPGVTAAYAVNVTLFGAITMALFFRGDRPSYGAPAGFHGAWNLAMLALGLLPEGRSLAAFEWSPGERLWSGGDAGPESGLAYSLVLGAVAAALWADARRRGLGLVRGRGLW
jgi:hypothetical protein